MYKQTTISTIDDNISAGNALSRLVKIHGYHAMVFNSAHEFINDATTTTTDLLVLDIWMPGMNGFDLLAHLVEVAYCIPAIFVSAQEDIGAQLRIVDYKTVTFLQKPFNDDDLLKGIIEGVNKRRKSPLQIVENRASFRAWWRVNLC